MERNLIRKYKKWEENGCLTGSKNSWVKSEIGGIVARDFTGSYHMNVEESIGFIKRIRI